MKFPVMFVTLTLNTFVVACSTLTVHADDYLLKESFESGKKSPTGWREGARVPGVEYIWSDSVASHGKRSLALKKTENRFFPIAQWFRSIPYEGGQANVEVCLKAKAAQAQKATVDLQFYDAGGEMIGHEWIAYLGAKEEGDGPADHDWGRFGGVVRIPPTTKKIGVALQIYGPGEVWFDELTMRFVPSSAEATRRLALRRLLKRLSLHRLNRRKPPLQQRRKAPSG